MQLAPGGEMKEQVSGKVEDAANYETTIESLVQEKEARANKVVSYSSRGTL